MIDKSGAWWKGAEFDDLVEYIRGFTAETYPADLVPQSACECGHVVFSVDYDGEQGCVRRTCVSCGRTGFIADSGDYWAEAHPVPLRCPCGNHAFELGVGFSLRESGDIRWITVGARCVACGILGAPTEWKVDYSPSAHLLAAV